VAELASDPEHRSGFTKGLWSTVPAYRDFGSRELDRGTCPIAQWGRSVMGIFRQPIGSEGAAQRSLRDWTRRLVQRSVEGE
jgi:hypothetical protein